MGKHNEKLAGLLEMVKAFTEEWERREIAWLTDANAEFKAGRAAGSIGKGSWDMYAWLESRGIPKAAASVVFYGTPDSIKRAVEMSTEDRAASLLRRIESKAGDIEEVISLSWNNNGGFDGEIRGTLRTVRVNTILAGGYNIQRLHCRTLVK